MSKERARRLRHLANRNKEPHWLYFLPLMLVLGFVPLIMRARITPLSEMEQFFFQGAQFHIDVFHFYKTVWFILLTIAAGLCLAYLHYLGIRIIEKKRWMIALGLYMVFVFLSFLNSDDFVVGWRGFATSYQGLLVYLAYGATIFIFSQMVRTKRDALLFIWPMVIMSTLIALVSASQYFGGPQFDDHAIFGPIKDVFTMPFFQRLITPSRFGEVEELVRVTLQVGWAYSTLYNPNFAGSFGAMLAFLGIAYYFLTPKIWQKGFMAWVILCGVFVVVASNSRAGFIGLAMALVVWVVMGLPYMLRYHKLTPFVVITLIVGSVYSIDQLAEGRYRDQVLRIVENLEPNEQVQIREVTLDGFNTILVSDENWLRVHWTGSQLLFYDEDDNIMPFTMDGTTYRLIDEDFESYSFQFQANQGRVRARFHGRLLDLYFVDEGFAIFGVGGFQTWTENATRVEALRGYERLFSARGYIYSVSIPLLRDTWFLGAGPDHYVLELPQRDIAGRLNGFGLTTGLDKPHNMFLQIATEVGVIGLLALFSILVWPTMKLLKGWFKPVPQGMFYVGLLAGIGGMMVSGLANDLIMSIAPMFFVLFGLLMTDIKEEA